MSEELAFYLKLPVEVTNPVSVSLGHGQHIECKGVCLGIALWVQDVEIIEDYLLLDWKQSDVDVILGYR